jgi:hypothetical protein
VANPSAVDDIARASPAGDITIDEASVDQPVQVIAASMERRTLDAAQVMLVDTNEDFATEERQLGGVCELRHVDKVWEGTDSDHCL